MELADRNNNHSKHWNYYLVRNSPGLRNSVTRVVSLGVAVNKLRPSVNDSVFPHQENVCPSSFYWETMEIRGSRNHALGLPREISIYLVPISCVEKDFLFFGNSFVTMRTMKINNKTLSSICLCIIYVRY